MNSIRTISLCGSTVAHLIFKNYLICSLLVLMAFMQSLDAQTCTNLLTNESFENGLANWTTTGNVELGNNALTGNQSAKLCTNGYSTLSQVFPAQPNVDYTASLWAKMENETTQAQAVLRYLDANYVPIPTNSDQVYVSIDNYQQYHLKNISPANTAYAHVLLWKNGDGCLETDDWQLCESSLPIKPDLSVNQLTVTPISLNPGDTMTVDFLIANFGTANLNGIYDTHIFLSETPSFDQNSFELTSSINQNAMEGFFVSSTIYPIIPAGFTPGNYYLIVALDYDEQYDELNEANNFLAVPIEIEGPPVICSDFVLNSQAEVNSFYCAAVLLDLTISGPDIVDLSPLSNLTFVGGAINIHDNPLLTSLVGLENTFGGKRLYIKDNPLLTDLSALANLSGYAIELVIENNDNLTYLNGLEGFTGGENVRIIGNPALESLIGLNGMTNAYNLRIEDNTVLQNVNGLGALEELGPNSYIKNNPSLQSLKGLSNLTEIFFSLTIADLPMLTNLDGLENLAFVPELVIDNNLILENIDALDSSLNIASSLKITNNPSLADCCGIFDFLQNSGSAMISNNLPGCNNSQEIVTSCGSTTCIGDIILTSQADIDNFSGCSMIDGNLYIRNLNPNGIGSLPTDIHNLSPLLSLTEVTGNVVIENNDLLVNLDGLNNVQKVSGLAVVLCDNLTSIQALSGISGDLIYITIFNNPLLESLNGLENITGISNGVSLEANDALTSLDGLIGLGGNGSVVQNIIIGNQSNLTSLQGLNNLTDMTGSLRINDCPVLQTMSGLENLATVNDLILVDNNALIDVSALQTLTHVQGNLIIQRNQVLEDCCTFYELLINNGVDGNIFIQDNPGTCNSETDILENCQPSGIDLELSMSISDPTPAIYSKYSVTLTMTNAGGLDATGIEVGFTKPAGVVYTGGNEFTASEGSFNPFGNQVWSVNSLAAGQSVTLTVNYFLLQNDLPVAYAQVIAANEPEADSTPNNGTPPTVNEDDEASSDNVSPPVSKPDLGIADLNILPVPVTTNGGTFSFFLINDGLATVSGSYEIGIYISDDEEISNDDIALPFFTEQNTPVAILTRNGSIPANLLPGEYFLIVKADVNEVISEVVENDNLVTKAFTVEGVTCTGNFFLTTQSDVENFPNCSVINGNLTIRPPSGMFTSDITDLSPLLTLTEVTGRLRIHYQDKLTDLSGMDNLSYCKDLEIFDCDSLNNIHALSGLHGEMDWVFVSNNYSLLNIDALDGVTAINNGTSVTFNESLQNINGFSDLTRAGSGGEAVHIGNNPSLTSLHGLENLTTADGYLQIESCNSLISLDGLNKVVTTDQLIIHLNDLLQDISALSSLTTISEDLYVYGNPMLSDCCILEDLLSNGSFSVQIYDNASSCNSKIDILNSCASQGPDLELSMTATNENPAIYTSSPITLTISNNGGESATGIVVHFPKPSGTAYTGGNEITASQGSFNPYGNEEWTVGDLPAGVSATMEVNYFYLTNDALTPYAQVIAQNEPDSDSSPNNGTCCTPLEDDEATILLNGFNGSGSSSFSMDLGRLRMFFDDIYPNPAKHWANVEIYSPKAQPALIDFYDATGKSVHRLEMELKAGKNEIGLDISDWRSGTYTLIGRGEGHPAYGRFLKIWE